MATTGEIIWAQLIARKLIRSDISIDREYISVMAVLPFRTMVIRKDTLLKDFFLKSFTLRFGSPSLSPRILIFLSLTPRREKASSTCSFELIWKPTITREKSWWKYVYLYSPDAVKIRLEFYKRDGFAPSGQSIAGNFYAGRGWYNSTPPKVPKSWTPRKILNLALRSRVVANGNISFAAQPFAKAFVPSYPSGRPSPEIRKTPWIQADEGPFGNPYVSFVQTPGYESFNRTYSGVRTPGYGKLKKKELPENPFTLNLYKAYSASGQDRRKGQGTGQTWSSIWRTSITLPQSVAVPAIQHDAGVYNKALQRLINSVNSGAASNIALNLAQANLITGMIAKAASRITGSIGALRKGNFPGAVNSLMNGRGPSNNQIRKGTPSASKSLASNWLELQYGWKPLLSDIDGALHSLAEYQFGSRSWLVARASANRSIKEMREDLRDLGTGVMKTGSVQWTNDHGCRFGVSYRVANPELAFLAQTGFTNPINLVWELLPWSFVVDWFLPIGPYLETLSGFHGMEFKKGFQVQFSRQTKHVDSNYTGVIPGTGGLSRWEWRQNIVELRVLVNRTPLGGFPSARFPNFRMGLNQTRAANALALMRQAFK